MLSNNAVQEVKVGFDQFHLLQKMPFSGINNTPTYRFPACLSAVTTDILSLPAVHC